MRQLLIITILLLSGVLHAPAQALTDRYTRQRPVVVVSDNERLTDITRCVTDALGLPCQFVTGSGAEAEEALKHGRADLVITDDSSERAAGRHASKSIVSYSRVTADSIAAMRFVGRDRQLIEQLDDQYMRLRESGKIAAVEEHWEHPELLSAQEEEKAALTIADVLLILSGILFLLSLILLWHIRATRRHSAEVREMMTQTNQMNQYYAIEDSQAAHDLVHKYEAILSNPFLAISFYDNNGKLIVQNEAMKRLGHENVTAQRQPLYNAEGRVVSYFVAIRCDRKD